MKLAQIILPTVDNGGNPLALLHRSLQRDICHIFGGYTSVPSEGGWIDPETSEFYQEPGRCYYIAAEDNSTSTETA